jgi:hypothetical protein
MSSMMSDSECASMSLSIHSMSISETVNETILQKDAPTREPEQSLRYLPGSSIIKLLKQYNAKYTTIPETHLDVWTVTRQHIMACVESIPHARIHIFGDNVGLEKARINIPSQQISASTYRFHSTKWLKGDRLRHMYAHCILFTHSYFDINLSVFATLILPQIEAGVEFVVMC